MQSGNMHPMRNFPTPTQIVETLNDLQPFITEGKHPRQGEVAAAQYIHDLAQKFGLGATRLTELPKSPEFEQYRKQGSDLANVVIEAGDGKDELLLLHGHYDVVPPTDYGGQSHKITRGATEGELKGLGSYDMLPGVAAILTALHKMRVARHRKIVAVLVFGEENDSEGTHALFDKHSDILAFPGKCVALSTEITVGSSIKDPYHLVVGRPGRLTYELSIPALMEHTGDYEDEHMASIASQRLGAASAALMKMAGTFPPHPNDSDGLMKRGQILEEHFSSNIPGSLSSPGGVYAKFNVHYANPQDSAAAIQQRMEQALEQTLGKDVPFELKKSERRMPWLEPWYEPTGEGTYARKMQNLANPIVAQSLQSQYAAFRCGKGVADENIISQHMPTVCVPPQGGNPHKRTEHCNIRSVTEYQAPVIRAAAAYDGMLSPDNGEDPYGGA